MQAGAEDAEKEAVRGAPATALTGEERFLRCLPRRHENPKPERKAQLLRPE